MQLRFLIKKTKDFIDFKKLDKIIIGVCGGDGIGPYISKVAKTVLENILSCKADPMDAFFGGQLAVDGNVGHALMLVELMKKEPVKKAPRKTTKKTDAKTAEKKPAAKKTATKKAEPEVAAEEKKPVKKTTRKTTKKADKE